MKTRIHRLCVLALTGCFVMTGCSTKDPIAEPPPTQPNSFLRADLASRRIVGREQVSLSKGRALYADHITKSADGTIKASGRVYVDGGERPSDQILGWPRYIYASDARWTPGSEILELAGLPILEYKKGRIVAISSESEITIVGDRIRTKGPTSIIMN